MNRRHVLKLGVAANAVLLSPAWMSLTFHPEQTSTKMKTLGLIGGTSWHSTIDYYRYLNEIVGERLGKPAVNPPLLMYSLNAELMQRNDWDEINQAYLDISLNLQNAGAEAIVICANAPHKVCPFVGPKLNIPFIHIAEAIGEQANRLELKNLGLLGTKPTMEESFITDPLSTQYHVKTKIPDETSRNKIHQVIVEELTQGIFEDNTKLFVIEEMKKLKSEGVDGIILGCTELPILVKPEDFDLPLLDTTHLHAQKAVDFILSGQGK